MRGLYRPVKLLTQVASPCQLISAMTTPGLLIAIEGIDGSGKQTQAKLLELSLKAEGIPVYSTGFPQYDSWFGSMVGKFLNGDLGPLESVDPHFTALLYAGDRFEAKSRLEAELNQGKVVIVDRYIGSNLAHQVARAMPEKRAEFLRWIEHLEYTIYKLPHEDLILYMRIPPSQSQQLVERKSGRAYTAAKYDLQEKISATWKMPRRCTICSRAAAPGPPFSASMRKTIVCGCRRKLRPRPCWRSSRSLQISAKAESWVFQNS